MSDDTSVLYNADCPVCSFEVDHYAAYADARALPLRFEDLNSCDLARWGVSADQAARRLHVLHQGQVYAGIDAFVILWEQMPRYRWLARLVGARPIRPIARSVYDRVLAPLLYAWHRRRAAKAATR